MRVRVIGQNRRRWRADAARSDPDVPSVHSTLTGSGAILVCKSPGASMERGEERVKNDERVECSRNGNRLIVLESRRK